MGPRVPVPRPLKVELLPKRDLPTSFDPHEGYTSVLFADLIDGSADIKQRHDADRSVQAERGDADAMINVDQSTDDDLNAAWYQLRTFVQRVRHLDARMPLRDVGQVDHRGVHRPALDILRHAVNAVLGVDAVQDEALSPDSVYAGANTVGSHQSTNELARVGIQVDRVLRHHCGSSLASSLMCCLQLIDSTATCCLLGSPATADSLAPTAHDLSVHWTAPASFEYGKSQPTHQLLLGLDRELSAYLSSSRFRPSFMSAFLSFFIFFSRTAISCSCAMIIASASLRITGSVPYFS